MFGVVSREKSQKTMYKLQVLLEDSWTIGSIKPYKMHALEDK